MDDDLIIARRILERIKAGGDLSATEKAKIVEEEIRSTGKFTDAEFIQKRIDVANVARTIREKEEHLSLRRAS